MKRWNAYEYVLRYVVGWILFKLWAKYFSDFSQISDRAKIIIIIGPYRMLSKLIYRTWRLALYCFNIASLFFIRLMWNFVFEHRIWHRIGWCALKVCQIFSSSTIYFFFFEERGPCQILNVFLNACFIYQAYQSLQNIFF